MNTSVIEAIERQKTTNLYDASKSIPDDQIRELVRLATFSPTAFHLQNWRFIAVRSPEAKAIIPINDVCRHYFPHLTPTKLVRKISVGEIAIPLVRVESSQKSAKGVHLADLAEYLDSRAEAARKEMIALTR
jgi:hypothetical protein